MERHDERRAFVRAGIEKGHERQYLEALAFAGVEGPAWADLTEEQRENVRQANRENAQELADFGHSLSR